MSSNSPRSRMASMTCSALAPLTATSSAFLARRSRMVRLASASRRSTLASFMDSASRVTRGRTMTLYTGDLPEPGSSAEQR